MVLFPAESTATADGVNEPPSVVHCDYTTVTSSESETFNSQKDTASDFKPSVNSDANVAAKDNPHTEAASGTDFAESSSVDTVQDIVPVIARKNSEDYNCFERIQCQGDASDDQGAQGYPVNQPCEQELRVKLVDYASSTSSCSSNEFFDDILACSDEPCPEILPKDAIRGLFQENRTSNAADLTSTKISAKNASAPIDLPLSSIEGFGITEGNSQPTDHIPVKIPTKSSRKAARANGKKCSTVAGKFIGEKKFIFYECTCKYKECNALAEIERKEIHKKFWANSNWLVQSNFICQTIKTSEPKRTSVKQSRVKHCRNYFLGDKHVCKLVYLKTLGISSGRINYCLNIKTHEGSCAPDKRGRRRAPNNTPECKLEEAKAFLDSLPKFQSHYSPSDRKYFHPDLTTTKLYELYCEKLSPGIPLHRRIFLRVLKKYNVPFYLPKAEICQTCDTLNVQIDAAENPNHQLLLDQKTAHRVQAEEARNALALATQNSKTEKGVLVFTFDFQKTQPLPHLTTSVAFYNRQLWLYNLGINTLHDNKGHMCTWLESEGERGANEICSCILEFLMTRNLSAIERVNTFSYCCGSQNSNRTMISFMMWACKKFDLKSWEHQFMEPGHSYLPNDSDFGKIEKRKKKCGPIYCKETYSALIKDSQPKSQFNVLDMSGKFKNVHNLVEQRKFVNANGESFDFLKLKWYKVFQNNSVHFRQTDGNDSIQHIEFPSLAESFETDLHPSVQSIKISKEKYKDLMALLQFVPEVRHKFYKNLEF
ncbi:hypothetical protein FHG87_005576 [Trinorchestia longiramus]|nr:hypothetical protein FHG87_005576 [Trinorchestia longiramus]